MLSSRPSGGPDASARGENAWKRFFVPGALAACVALSTLMWVLKPIPHGHRYDLAFQLSLCLTLLWLLDRASPEWTFKKGILIPVLLIGLALGALNLSTIDFNSEIVHCYGDVFKAIDGGRNPYTGQTIFHSGEGGQIVYGNFNYPPMEIYPYYLAYRICGAWNAGVLTATMLLIHALCCLVFVKMFPRIRLVYVIPYFSFFMFGEVRTNPAMTFLVTALILLFIRQDAKRPRRWSRYLIAVLFGIGLATKFLIIPLMAAYYWHKFDPKRLRSLATIALDTGIAVGTTALIMLPYGVKTVFKNTILFNLVLKDRAVLTTFYPNALSGPFSWLGLSGLYSYAAVAILALSILVAPKLKLFSAMLAAAYTFLLVAPTPEPQYLPIVLFLVLTARCAAVEDEGPVPPRVWKRLTAG
jgi:hypothetical protein